MSEPLNATINDFKVDDEVALLDTGLDSLREIRDDIH
jgi:aryl carrier-like protein